MKTDRGVNKSEQPMKASTLDNELSSQNSPSMQDINEELVAQIGPISLEDILSEPTLDPLPSSHEPPRKVAKFFSN